MAVSATQRDSRCAASCARSSTCRRGSRTPTASARTSTAPTCYFDTPPGVAAGRRPVAGRRRRPAGRQGARRRARTSSTTSRLDGSGAPASGGIHIDERPELEDERAFAGAYAQALWTPAPRWTLDAGLRLNHTHEKQEGEVEGEDGDEAARDERTDTRLSGGVGASFLAWRGDREAVWLFAHCKDAFKPAAVDFGPEAGGRDPRPRDGADGRGRRQGRPRRRPAELAGRARSAWTSTTWWWRAPSTACRRSRTPASSASRASRSRDAGGSREGLARRGFLRLARGEVPRLRAPSSTACRPSSPATAWRCRRTSSAALGLTWAPPRGWRAWAGGQLRRRALPRQAQPRPRRRLHHARGRPRLPLREPARCASTATTSATSVRRWPRASWARPQYYRLPARRLRAGVTWRF